MSGLEQLGLRDVVEQLRAGMLASADYTAALLTHTESLEKTIHAFAWLNRAHALKAARATDAAHAAGMKSGRLHGVPIGVKEVIAAAGLPTGMGSPDLMPSSRRRPAARPRLPSNMPATRPSARSGHCWEFRR